jgi:dihydroxyacetone kinase-like protein
VTAPAGISAPRFKQALAAAGDRVRGARDELCALDAAAGDGDLGVTLDAGFAQVAVVLDGSSEDADIGALLRQIGLELATKAPSTIGTLLASAFLRAGRELAGRTELGGTDAVVFLSASAAGVAERGHASVGERTVLDAMAEAADAAAAKAAQSDSAVEILEAGAAGAQEGAAATAVMEPRHGRANWIKERAQGSRDAGAVAWAVFLSGLAESCSVSQVEQVNPV